jgi:hypothetical protein
MKTYRRHNCGRRHRTYRAFVECAIPSAVWVQGDGPVALIAWCGQPTVTLCADADTAKRAKATIDASGCGGSCSKRHEVVGLEL